MPSHKNYSNNAPFELSNAGAPGLHLTRACIAQIAQGEPRETSMTPADEATCIALWQADIETAVVIDKL
jgi:hypothetical protein